VKEDHTEFADEVSLWNSNDNVNEAVDQTNQDMKKINEWSGKWNMKVAPGNPQALIIGNKSGLTQMLNSQDIEIVKKTKKLLGVT